MSDKQDKTKRALENSRPVADVDTPTAADQEKMLYIIESLAASLDYDGIKKWLESYPTLDEAFEAASNLRQGMIAT